jgi:hypothetical protein
MEEKKELREKLENVLERVILGVSEELQGDYTETYNVYFSDVDTIKEEFLSKLEPFIRQELDRAREEVLLELLEKKTNYKIEEVGHGYKVTQEYVLVSDIEKELSKLKSKLTTK